MKDAKKIVVFMLIIFLILLIGDSMYGYVNKSVPLIHFKDKSKGIDRCLFFNVYHCRDNENEIVGKFSKFECSKDNKSKNEEVTSTTKQPIMTKKISERKKAFSEEILNKYTEFGYVDKDNLKTFNIERILNIGYYASKPDEIYYQVAFNYECKGGGRSCVSLEINDDSLYEFEGNYYFSLVAKNDKVIKIMSGVAFNFNSDYVPQQEEIK